MTMKNAKEEISLRCRHSPLDKKKYFNAFPREK
jgi:hypothetical protein